MEFYFKISLPFSPRVLIFVRVVLSGTLLMSITIARGKLAIGSFEAFERSSLAKTGQVITSFAGYYPKAFLKFGSSIS